VPGFRGAAEMTEQRYRRAAGLLLGAMFGFAYTLVSQLINRVALPGLPLYQPPLGPAGNIVLALLAGAGLGLLCAWPASAAKGILLGGAAAALAVFAFTLLRMGAGAASTLVGLVLSAPMAWVGVLGMAVVRWLVGPAAPPPAPAADPDRRAGARGCLRSLQRRRPARTAPDTRYDRGRAGCPRQRLAAGTAAGAQR
jgi:hypothetical protein